MLGRTEGAVKALQHRALHALQQILERDREASRVRESGMDDRAWETETVLMTEPIEMENAVGSPRAQSGSSIHGTRGARGPF
jgi:hypothetical protein